MGVVIVTQDLLLYGPDFILNSSYDLTGNLVLPGSNVAIPALSLANCNWLQSYIDSNDIESI